MAPITLYFLQTSRAIRTAFLLEALELDYNVEYFNREADGSTPQDFRKTISVGRAPAIQDDGLILVESSTIAEYLCEKYDKECKLMPADTAMRSQVRVWMSASEGTFLIHALAIAYGSGAAPESSEKLAAGLAPQVHRDFDWLESELEKGSGKFLVGDRLTAADTMMGFSIAFILKMGLGTKGKEWPAVKAWLANVENTPAYQRAVEKTGHTLG
ncbi:hypothetical protein E4T39_08563 [Aureobasidium subglaciale]|nr:hypothetical protein E4T39_08563 [Aureobasidium subglaciale]